MQANKRNYMVIHHKRLLTLDQVAERCHVHPHFIKHLCDIGLVESAEEHRDLFPPETTARIQRVLRLRRDLAINFNGIAVVLELLDQIAVLEARLRHSGPLR